MHANADDSSSRYPRVGVDKGEAGGDKRAGNSRGQRGEGEGGVPQAVDQIMRAAHTAMGGIRFLHFCPRNRRHVRRCLYGCV